jgi:uncharacterized protein (DUF305 family)
MKDKHEMKHENMNMEHGGMMKNHYLRLLLMVLLSFASMYALMYAMVNTFADVYPNINQFYMAGLMTAPMVLIELVLMGSMYHNKKLNLTIIALSVIALAGFWFSIRQQTMVADKQFLKSMIPHHSGAILMCREAVITDPEIKQLCGDIINSQAKEIQQMNDILNRLDK